MTLLGLDGTQWIIVLLVLGVISLFVYFQLRGDNQYDFLQTLEDANGKTSIGAHFAWGFYVCAIWLIIRNGVNDPAETWPWVRDALVISLGYRVASRGIDVIGKRPPAQPSPPDNIEQQVVVTPGGVAQQ